MKILLSIICGLSVTVFCFSEEEAEALPEPSEPPFEVGHMPMESGYTITREDAPDLNFRIVDSRMRLYWIDEDGLIMEPEVDRVAVRFTGSVRGRAYHSLGPLQEDVGLGSPYNLLLPHLYNVTLVVGSSEQGNLETYRFRYNPTMDAVREPTPDAEL